MVRRFLLRELGGLLCVGLVLSGAHVVGLIAAAL